MTVNSELHDLIQHARKSIQHADDSRYTAYQAVITKLLISEILDDHLIDDIELLKATLQQQAATLETVKALAKVARRIT